MIPTSPIDIRSRQTKSLSMSENDDDENEEHTRFSFTVTMDADSEVGTRVQPNGESRDRRSNNVHLWEFLRFVSRRKLSLEIVRCCQLLASLCPQSTVFSSATRDYKFTTPDSAPPHINWTRIERIYIIILVTCRFLCKKFCFAVKRRQVFII